MHIRVSIYYILQNVLTVGMVLRNMQGILLSCCRVSFRWSNPRKCRGCTWLDAVPNSGDSSIVETLQHGYSGISAESTEPASKHGHCTGPGLTACLLAEKLQPPAVLGNVDQYVNVFPVPTSVYVLA